MTRAELLSRMSSAELSDWMALWWLRNDEKEQAAKEAALRRR